MNENFSRLVQCRCGEWLLVGCGAEGCMNVWKDGPVHYNINIFGRNMFVGGLTRYISDRNSTPRAPKGGACEGAAQARGAEVALR
jgi:hypothetical protein